MKKQRARALLTGTLMLLFFGLIYGWSVFVTPLEAEFHWARTESALVFTFSMIFFCLGGFTSGLLLKRRTHRFVLRLAAACLFIGFLSASFTQSLIWIYFSYGVLCGTGVGFGYNSILSTVAKWYPDKPGLCSGVLLLGFGTGALLLSAGATALIAAFGWRMTFMIFAGLFALVILLLTQLLRAPTPEEAAQLPQRAQIDAEAQFTPAAMLRRPSFYLLCAWSTFIAAAGLAIIGQAAPIALELGVSVAFATTATGLISVCNGLGRFIGGSLFDKLGRKRTMLLVCSLSMLAMPLLYFAIQASSPALLIAGFVALGLFFGGLPSTLSAALIRLYGPKHYALNFGILNFHIIPAAIAGPMIMGSIQGATGSYQAGFPVLLGICLPAAAAALLLKRA